MGVELRRGAGVGREVGTGRRRMAGVGGRGNDRYVGKYVDVIVVEENVRKIVAKVGEELEVFEDEAGCCC